MKQFADEITAEPLLKAIESAVKAAIAANVDADWILNAVENTVYGEDCNGY